jgi:hypothetical protein
MLTIRKLRAELVFLQKKFKRAANFPTTPVVVLALRLP